MSAIATLALAVALVLQYAFGWQPCHLCVLQRIPYGLAILPGLAMLYPPARKYALPLLWAQALIWLASLVLGFYHIGVEELWWSSGVCEADLSATTLDAFYASLSDHPSSCANVPYHILGQSLARWNALLSAACLGYSLFVIAHAFKNQNAKTAQKITG